MSKVVLHFSMSLDGFIAGPGVTVASPMGEGDAGLHLHDWIFEKPQDAIDAEAAEQMQAGTGAVVLGRRTFDVGIGEWKDVPYPAPCFVLTHRPQAPLAQKSGAFTFVADGIESAIAQARAAAGDRDVTVMGADTAQQALKAGLVDELKLQVVPILMARGVRLFDRLGVDGIDLELIRQAQSPRVTHLHYRVLK
ncbi:dihydrofolate reductase family protein [Luteimonas sp. SX5]|uniref:Dihydrofolate reductase family protein n=1 Tax=Luteimonas galliterrae TaxID=2940486 RepID=A0ABT0MGQ9_9GAMM|nr:dihydrofolate reductase family protein [Luteimonas galliterrae]MCL1633848.1 dihydrofolate reductase family protein [Luteimonas galliterrae]